MAKDTYYFSHDYNTRNDSKIKKLLSRHGFLGYGLFWAIIEDLYNNANALPTDYDSIAFDLRTDKETIKSIVNDFELFVFDGDKFGSLSVQRRLDERNQKSIKARESALNRWKPKERDANAFQSQSKGNARKEKKVKQIKEKFIVLAEYQETFDRWLDYKSKRKETYKNEDSLKACFSKLLNFSKNSPALAAQIIEDAMANNYSGFFEPKGGLRKQETEEVEEVDILKRWKELGGK
jgi:Domain of unknown function (DUF4373)